MLQTVDDPFAFGQLVLHGDHIAYVHHPSTRSQVVVDDLRDGTRVEASPVGEFTRYQYPQLSPDGQRVSYSDERMLQARLLTDEATKTLVTCAQRHCPHAWDSTTTVLVLDDGQLSRVSLDGTTTALAADVEGFAVAGVPG